RGLRQYDNRLLLAGAVPAALLALVADFSLGLLAQRFDFSKSRRGLTAAQKVILILIALVVALVGLGMVRSAQQHARTTGTSPVIVGSKDFTESIILAEIVAQSLEARGVAVERKFELGGNLPHEALAGGRLDLYPEYTGTSYTTILRHPPVNDPRT